MMYLYTMLSIKSSHKYLVSLTLVLSLISFSGFELEQQLPHSFKTEMIVEPYTQSQLFYVNYNKQLIATEYSYSCVLPIDNINYSLCEKEQYSLRINKIVNFNLDYIKLLSLVNATIG